MSGHEITQTKPSAQPVSVMLNLLALTLLYVCLLLPNRLSLLTPSSFAHFPPEALLLGLMLLIPWKAAWLLRGFSAFLLTTGLLLKLFDIGTYQVFDRPFNPVLDSHLPMDGMNLISGSLGSIGAWLVLGCVLILPFGLTLIFYLALGRMQAMLLLRSKSAASGLAAGLFIYTIAVFNGWQNAAPNFTQMLAYHVHTARSSLAEMEAFEQALQLPPYSPTSPDSLFAKLKGKDVLVVFIESYGRTVLDNADYATHIYPLLEQSGSQLAAHGIHARSAFLTSPTVGGISWLAHATTLSGLWINNQVRYDSLIKSARPSLNRLFQQVGWRTVAVKPAHTKPWPEGDYFGYDQVYAAQDLGYQGKPFNWITMPDQYTLSAFQSRERKSGFRQPVMAEIALISSHAPWTPLPQLVDWQQIGNGAIFSQQADAGESPENVWKTTARIREQYCRSIEYALENLVSYAIAYGDDDLVILAMGDHQPAPFVAQSDNHDVPVHLISRDKSILQAIDSWQWRDGMIPGDTTPVLTMDKLLERFVMAFSTALPDKTS